MNDGKGYCDHEIEDPTCVCQLEGIIERRENLKGILYMMGRDPELDYEAFNQKYWQDPWVYNLVNFLELLYKKNEELRTELMWLCQYVMGDLEDVTPTQAGFRAFNISKKLM